MSNKRVGPVAKELIEAKERIADIDNWCPEGQGHDGKDGHRMCAAVALEVSEATSKAYNGAIRYLEEGGRSIVETNGKGHEAVMQMYDRAIFRALSDGE